MFHIRRAGSGFSERVNFRVGDIQGLPFESGSLDFVVSTDNLDS
ncbi:methyltransferase domain-containing protein [Chloroflexota bacterium]